LKEDTTAIVLLSGGQDSFVCLLWARERFARLEAVSVSYGQRHALETFYATRLAHRYGVPHRVLDLGGLLRDLAPSALLEEGELAGAHPVAGELPASFVPNRNGLFLTLAATHAFALGEPRLELVIGACETDYSGYPDCRDVYLKAKAVELSLGLGRPVTIHTPLMWKTKAETFAMAEAAGELDALITDTLTCYAGDETPHDWGRGCGACPACSLREKGWDAYRLSR
jgi:7-cyano-7-deazaguanine synthase